MKKKLLAVALLSAFSVPALAANDESGLYLVGAAGNVTNINNVDMTTSLGGSGLSLNGSLGYQFNEFFSVEGGMIILAEKANYIIPPVGYTGVGSTYTSTSLSGTEFAAVLGLPVTEDFSLLARLGFASLERTNNPSPPEVEVAWKGSVVGVAMQYLLPHDFAIGGSRMNIGFRLGANTYNLKDATGLLTETPSYTYVAGVIHF